MERTPSKSQHTKLTLEKTILPPLQPGLELATFRSRVWHSNQQAYQNCSSETRLHQQQKQEEEEQEEEEREKEGKRRRFRPMQNRYIIR